jgi:hypothetical protein
MDITISTVGLEELASNNFSIYPNPNNGQFTIQLNQVQEHGSKVTITNTIGQVVYQAVINQKVSNIDIPNMDKGTYILTLENQNKLDRQLFIVK